MDKKEFKKLFKLAVEKAFGSNGVTKEKNNMQLKMKTEKEIKEAYKKHAKGLVTTEEILDLEWYYFENWVDPIQSHSKFSIDQGLGPIILN
jgi:hypothetical protein